MKTFDIKSKEYIFNTISKKVMVHSYKFNGWLYRTWEYPIIIDNTEEYVVLASQNAEIMTGEFNTKRCFSSIIQKPTFWFFFKKEWFNVVCTILPNNGVQNYINISSPFIYEDLAFKYVDLDLDFKIFANNIWCEVDKKDFQEHQVLYSYPQKLINKVLLAEEKVTNLIEEGFFKKLNNSIFDKNYLKKYQDIISSQKKVV